MARKPVPRTYAPDEMRAAIAVLQNNGYHNFHEGDAIGIVKALHNAGFRIVRRVCDEGDTEAQRVLDQLCEDDEPETGIDEDFYKNAPF